jgi:PAT family beta-lactamase induction signal transducer AmpG
MSGATAQDRPGILGVLREPRMAFILLMGAASGFPNQLTESALQAWLKDFHLSNTRIGLLSYVALPYLLKFLWAPLLDRFAPPWLGRRRSWIALLQFLLAGAIGLLAFQDPATGLGAAALVALLIAFLSASQDIVIDAWRADVATPAERGAAAAAAGLGYRAAAWLAFALALVVAEQAGWPTAFTLLAFCMVLLALACLRAPEPAALPAPAPGLRGALLEPLAELFATPGARALVALILVFKLGDAFALKFFTPFLMDLGFSKLEIGVVAKAVFTGASIAGAVAGGLWMVRLGLAASMLTFGALQALSNLAYVGLALAGKNFAIMLTAVAVENFAHAMGNVALVAVIMGLCDRRFSAFQYALLSVIAQLPRYALGAPAGWVADHAGWSGYYLISFALGMPGLAATWWLRGRLAALDRP